MSRFKPSCCDVGFWSKACIFHRRLFPTAGTQVIVTSVAIHATTLKHASNLACCSYIEDKLNFLQRAIFSFTRLRKDKRWSYGNVRRTIIKAPVIQNAKKIQILLFLEILVVIVPFITPGWFVTIWSCSENSWDWES